MPRKAVVKKRGGKKRETGIWVRDGGFGYSQVRREREKEKRSRKYRHDYAGI